MVINNNLMGTVVLPYDFIIEKKEDLKDITIIRVGARRKTVHIMIDVGLKENVIQFSPNLKDFFLLPDDVSFDVSIVNGELHIGPVIGLLMAKNESALTKKRLQDYSTFALKYDDINGLVCVFSRDKIDTKQKTITGYYFQPNVSPGEVPWKKAAFPYPDVIFQRSYIPYNLFKHLKSEIGETIINYPELYHKRTMAQWLEKDPSLINYLPETKMLKSAKDLEEMLQKHQKVFLKPVASCFGYGIIVVMRKEDGDHFCFRQEPEDRIIKERDEMDVQVKAITAEREYIVQQGINDITYEGRKLDFRLIMQKNQSQQWACTGIVALPGLVGGMDSHMKIYGQHSEGMTFEDTMEKTSYLPSGEIERTKSEMIEISKKACELMDHHGLYGDLGVDVILDQSYRPWLIEVNVRHTHEVPLYAGDRQMYETMRTRILEYSKSLAGFNYNMDDNI